MRIYGCESFWVCNRLGRPFRAIGIHNSLALDKQAPLRQGFFWGAAKKGCKNSPLQRGMGAGRQNEFLSTVI